ncbi:MAG: aldo/keto reductase, partial [Kofleriaceae bacterium]
LAHAHELAGIRRGFAVHPIDPAIVAADRDPAVREAALHADTAAAATRDPDPWVRRAALRLLAQAPAATPQAREVARRALESSDPWMRAEACRISIDGPDHLALVLERTVDRDEAVRSSALDALERLPASDDQVRELLGSELAPGVRALVYGWLVRRLDDTAATLARTALASETDPRVRKILAAAGGHDEAGLAVALARPAEVALVSPDIAPPRTDLERRPFGRAGFTVAPLAISGAYDLSSRALAEAHSAGVDLYFWESGYDELAQFLRARNRRNRTHVITGSYHADARSIRIDVDRALHQLRRDRLDAFLLFWTRSPARLDDETFDVLDALKREGKIGAAGFSTHHRDLARTAIEDRPWDIVMIRHSAAHPGIERDLLPVAQARGTAIVTFSALCYGRLLTGPGAPTASECYRYSLSQPGVVACISAPRRRRELVANLEVLRDPTLTPARIEELRAHGLGVRAESQRFNTLMRQPTRDAAAAAREMLESELPPTESVPRRLPTASPARRTRTRLGATRRGALIARIARGRGAAVVTNMRRSCPRGELASSMALRHG